VSLASNPFAAPLRHQAPVRADSMTLVWPGRRIMAGAELHDLTAAEHIMGMPAVARHYWTAADVRALIEESRHWPRYELLRGELLVTPAPEPRHQLIVGELFALVREYVERERLGVTFTSPADIELAPESIMQPDVFVVPNDCIPPEPPMRWSHVRRLLLAAEVLAPSSLRQDRIEKRDHYLAHGVAQYWIVDPDARVFECWAPERAGPVLVRDRLAWQPLPGGAPFELDVREFFERRCRLPRLF